VAAGYTPVPSSGLRPAIPGCSLGPSIIKDFAISYVTRGTLNAKRSNAVLMVTAISGHHHQRIDFLIGSGKALDTAKYFVIATDAIGNGLTTSPSNSTTQPRHEVPEVRHA